MEDYEEKLNKNFKAKIKRAYNRYFDDDAADEYFDYKRLINAEKFFNELITKIQKRKATIGIAAKYKLPKWMRLKPKKNENRRKISKCFYDVYLDMWNSTFTYDETVALSDKLNLNRFTKDGKSYHYVLSMPSVEELANKYDLSKVAVRKIIDTWCGGKKKSMFKLGYDQPKYHGGRLIYAMGYWKFWKNEEDQSGIRKIKFLSERNSKNFLRDILFTKKKWFNQK
jgi:hypothetical protein